MTVSRYTVHKWLAIPMGLVLIAWLVSGIVMTIPGSPPDIVDRPTSPPDFTRLQIAPAQAVAAARDDLGGEPRTQQIILRPLLDGMVYDVRTTGGVRLIDAASGEPVRITPELASRIALAGVRQGIEVSGVRRLDRHQGAYRFGPIPVYEVTFADGGGARAYVSAVSGVVQYGSRVGQIRTAVSSLHDFFILTLFVENEHVRRTLLVLASAATILLALSGYYLVLTGARRTRRPKTG